MNPKTTEVIDAGDGVAVDMGFYNIHPVRDRFEETCDLGMIEMLMKQFDLTFDEAITKDLYYACRMVVRDTKAGGCFQWIQDTAEAVARAEASG